MTSLTRRHGTSSNWGSRIRWMCPIGPSFVRFLFYKPYLKRPNSPHLVRIPRRQISRTAAATCNPSAANCSLQSHTIKRHVLDKPDIYVLVARERYKVTDLRRGWRESGGGSACQTSIWTIPQHFVTGYQMSFVFKNVMQRVPRYIVLLLK
jgi:hypothetical protein